MIYSATDAAIGRRLRAIREANGLSQRELARRAGVTNSSISMIEQGQVSPSVSSLEKLLMAFPMSLGHFFSVDGNAPSAVFFNAPDPTCEFIAQSPAAGVSLKRLSMAPGCDDVQLTHSVAQVVWLLAGEVQINAGEQVRELLTDQGLNLPAYCPCSVRNKTESIATIMIAAELPRREL